MNLKSKGIIMIAFLLASTIPAEAQYDFSVDVTQGCTPLKVKYTFSSTATVDTISSYYWDFGNGMTSSLMNPDTVVYDLPGIYTATLILNGNNSSTTMISKAALITVYRTVIADFRYYDTVDYNTYVFEHTDLLDNTATYIFLWDFEGVGTRTDRREIIEFPVASPSVDTFQVTLIVTDNHGCSSTVRKDVIILEDIKVQNVFSPNGDNINDFFIITSRGSYPLKIKVFTRTGVLVYENEGFTITWDGRTASGQQLNTGVYFYVLEALSGDPSNRYSKSGPLYLYK